MNLNNNYHSTLSECREEEELEERPFLRPKVKQKLTSSSNSSSCTEIGQDEVNVNNMKNKVKKHFSFSGHIAKPKIYNSQENGGTKQLRNTNSLAVPMQVG